MIPPIVKRLKQFVYSLTPYWPRSAFRYGGAEWLCRHHANLTTPENQLVSRSTIAHRTILVRLSLLLHHKWAGASASSLFQSIERLFLVQDLFIYRLVVYLVYM